MTMTVAFSESDISKIHVGQPATVTLDALTGVELAAHVSSISTLATTSSGVVSYDATLTLDQLDSRVKPGMSASASVITNQAQGVTLPNSAVTSTGSLTTVNVLDGSKTVATPVVVGLRGDTRTQIITGLRAGAQVVVNTTLPPLGAASSAASSATGGLGGLRRFGGGGLGGGGFGGRFLGGGG
jgi:multidrug efflux pump subunit AcrA (membrane-fusion protein)